MSNTWYEDVQARSKGISNHSVIAVAFGSAQPSPGLSWLDVGCGSGDLSRRIRDEAQPRVHRATDLLDWLADDLRGDVDLVLGPAETVLPGLPPHDRVMMVEVLEHLEAPWTVLRLCAQRVAPGGRLVVTTPNVRSLRHRLELLLRGQLTTFRPDHPPHLTPGLPHVIENVLCSEGLQTQRGYAGIDMLPRGGDRRWPVAMAERWPTLSHTSLVITGSRPIGGAAA